MLKLLKIVKDAGEVTIKYPFAPANFTPAFRGKPEYNPAQCIACSACAVACPANALTVETDLEKGTLTWQFFVGRCIYCGRCEEVCPTRAIVLSQNFELAVFNKEDLYERATFKLCHCLECGRPFAPQKQIDYALALTAQAGAGADEMETLKIQFAICPECKRRNHLNDHLSTLCDLQTSGEK
ncbi:MAG: hydrogenase 4 subunit H [Deltaproteobacteria bacterium]|jgi:formate hydrogenlyase subunit 6/NADH:ubiquinone oxidoreductase subunit I|nr:hydrogenase 4 subunit H [Deltaproteobacteria bacterium]